MGGGLAFLNKKGWHPGSIRNQEKVWAREQEHEAEQRKMEEMREAIEQERQQEELRGLACKAGLKQENNSMDWLYQGGMRAQAAANNQASAQPAAAAAAAAPEPPPPQAPEPAQLPAFLTEDTPASANEVWVRLHNDPLFAIKQQEIAARKSVMANPVKMDAVKKQAEAVAAEKAARKQAKKDAKAAKKAKKQARKDKRARAKDDSSDDSDSASDAHRSDRHHSTRDRAERTAAEVPSSANGEARHRAEKKEGKSGKEGGYGLRMSGAAPQTVADTDRSAAAEATRARLEKAAADKEEEERWKASQRYVRKTHKTGKLTEEERQARLAEMTGNADVHEEARWQRLANARKRDDADTGPAPDDSAAGEDKQTGGKHGSKHDEYMKNTMREMYGTGTSVEDQVGRRKYYSERGGDRAAFRR
ncbi:hypothetical protein WJX73_009574 [Symbiochloris irregularis]|uniref:CBF1-interacting co-repressor CIR N-terminal domain-containing protein n=1 Tax=Symbiochloris irregularis TaxID=706552 RepID=A0AAW1NNL5_9CHLO